MFKLQIFTFSILLIFSSCKNEVSENSQQEVNLNKNEVIVIGTIHGEHLNQAEYDTTVLAEIIERINPDIILTEIPPDRFEAAMNEFLEKDTITEDRVRHFPEYVNVIFPLTKKMHFKIIPTAGWTKEMSDARNKKLNEISLDSTRTKEWNELLAAGQISDSLIKASGHKFDPYWINSPAYDSLVEIELSVYNRLFNEELGLGGWDNINKAHFKYISDALDENQFEGKTILITYGAGHKGWFLKELKKREDIILKELVDYD